MKDSKYYKKILERNKESNKDWLNKLLISIIIVLVCLIVTNFDSNLRDTFKKEVLEDNISFNEFNKLYKRLVSRGSEDVLVNGVVVDKDKMEEVDGRYRFNYGIDYQIEALKPGIIVFNGDKDNLGDTIIIQGNDGVDIWYSGVALKNYSLYDYISTGDILGISNDVYLTISIYKDGELLKYEEYFG